MPSSNRTEDEDHIARTFAVFAERIVPEDQWTRLVRQLDEDGSSPAVVPPRRPGLVKVAASIALVAVLVGGGFAIVRPTIPGSPFGSEREAFECPETVTSVALPRDFEQVGEGKHLVFGDRVIQQAPLVVEPREAPEPLFDTSELGDEIRYSPLTPAQTVEVLDRVNQPLAGGSVVKVVVAGAIADVPWLIEFVDRSADATFGGATSRTRSVGAGLRPWGGFAQPVDPAGDALFEFPMSVVASDWSGFGVMDNESTAWDALAPDVSVVTFETGGQRAWIRPRAGLAAFPIPVALGESARFRAFDHLGNHIGCTIMTRG